MMQLSILILPMPSKVRDSFLVFEYIANYVKGPEKLLEVWFSDSETSLPPSCGTNGLKSVPAEAWKGMLEVVHCKVLSVVESEKVDAYLLSESSMFVFPHKLILKTCGTTTLLSGLPRILEIAATLANFPHNLADNRLGTATAAYPYRVFYSRKNFLYPDRQRGPHRSWRDEVKSLDKLFLGGSAYVIGKLNGEHWYLYLTEPNTMLTPPASPDRRETEIKTIDLPAARASLKSNSEDEDDDETLEVLMTDLEPGNAKQFYLSHASGVAEGQWYQRAHEARAEAQRHLGSLSDLPTTDRGAPKTPGVSALDEVDVFSNSSSDPNDVMSSSQDISYPEELTTEGHSLGTVVSESSGLADIYPTSKYPDARIDAYLFTPCGFSANGVVPAPNGPDATHYFTVHVTPEPHCSYASFETNVPHKQSGRQTADIIEQVIKIFKPGRFTVTLFEGKKKRPLDDSSEDEMNKRGGRGVTWGSKKDCRCDVFKGYRRVDRIVHDLDGYDLVFRYFEKIGWEGGGVRIGERDDWGAGF